MTAKEYLSQAYHVDHEIQNLLRRLDEMRSTTQQLTASYDHVQVSHSVNVSSMEDAIIRMLEKEQEISAEIDRLVALKLEIANTIDAVKKPTYHLVLEKRYLSYMAWQTIADEMHYSVRWVRNTHDRALKVVDRLLKQKN